MAVGNRALSGPINIHCDHSDSMLVRDSGVIQLFAENAQEAYDLMVIATRLAEHPDILLPVLVCQDGFTITHSAEPVALLPDDVVRGFVGEYEIPHALLDLARPTSQGPFAMPDSYFELRHQQLEAIRTALDVFPGIAADFAEVSGRSYSVLEPYALEDAERAIVCLGSTGGTVKDVVDELRDEGERVGLLQIRSFRPFPRDAVRDALSHLTGVSVLDRADSPGGWPPLFADVAASLYGSDVYLRSHVYGLGGRDIHPARIREVFDPAGAPSYLDLRGAPCLV
jgi:pyruvate ferredoxin oxidoreductase alpha subunit